MHQGCLEVERVRVTLRAQIFAGTDCRQVLVVEEKMTRFTGAVTLRQSWVDTPCWPGSQIRIVGNFDATGQCLINDSAGFLILYPDHLFSATVVADSFSCLRRAALQVRVKATSPANAPQMFGHILHEILQDAMRANKWDKEWLNHSANNLIPKYHDSMVELGLDECSVLKHLRSKFPALQTCSRLFTKQFTVSIWPVVICFELC